MRCSSQRQADSIGASAGLCGGGSGYDGVGRMPSPFECRAAGTTAGDRAGRHRAGAVCTTGAADHGARRSAYRSRRKRRSPRWQTGWGPDRLAALCSIPAAARCIGWNPTRTAASEGGASAGDPLRVQHAGGDGALRRPEARPDRWWAWASRSRGPQPATPRGGLGGAPHGHRRRQSTGLRGNARRRKAGPQPTS